MVADKRFIESQDVETLQLDWGTIKWLSSPDVTGAETFTMGIVILEPGKGHERHNHPNSEEVLYILDGEGHQTVGDEERDVSTGDTVYIPAGVEHSTINTAWKPLRVMALYGPPGPEEELRELAPEILPPGELPDY